MNAVWQGMRKLDKELVHKDFDDDLLVCNGRGAVPAVLDTAMIAAQNLSVADTEILQIHYVPCTHADCFFHPTNHTPICRTCPSPFHAGWSMRWRTARKSTASSTITWRRQTPFCCG